MVVVVVVVVVLLVVVLFSNRGVCTVKSVFVLL